ncbi:hypothetical protein Nmel_004795 [Mimus melanotis]
MSAVLQSLPFSRMSIASAKEE